MQCKESVMTNSPIGQRRPSERKADHQLPENSPENLDRKLDHAIKETFPTSDPVSVSITKGEAIDYDGQGARAEPGGQIQDGQGKAENLLNDARETLREVAGSASEAAREAVSKGRRYVRQAGERYPEAERYYREGSRAIGQQVTDKPLLSLLVAGAVGYALAWMIHGNSGSRTDRVPSYGRTQRGYAPHRSPST
jgi:ElaB/YqjD/DUF883 family membrane-anchored ribosome-binding protein